MNCCFRYCQKITGGTDFSSVHAEFFTHEETVSENTTAVKSTLYLPLGCFCQQIIEVGYRVPSKLMQTFTLALSSGVKAEISLGVGLGSNVTYLHRFLYNYNNNNNNLLIFILSEKNTMDLQWKRQKVLFKITI